MSGAFLQLDNGGGTTYWRATVDEMASLRMTTVIVQTIGYADDSGAEDAIDPGIVTAVLDQAETHSMTVLIGLRHETGNGDESAARDAARVNRWIAAGRASADQIAARHGNHPAFGGWYLPMEAWTPRDARELGHLPDCLRDHPLPPSARSAPSAGREHG